jgi:hypothetical protein
LRPFDETGIEATKAPIMIRVAPGGQYFTQDIVQSLGLPSTFLGWLSISSDNPVSIYNHRLMGDTGAIVPFRPR